MGTRLTIFFALAIVSFLAAPVNPAVVAIFIIGIPTTLLTVGVYRLTSWLISKAATHLPAHQAKLLLTITGIGR